MLHTHGSKRKVLFSSDTPVSVPPNSEMVLKLKCTTPRGYHWARNSPMVMEPTRYLLETGIILGQSVTTCRTPHVLVLNPTEEDIEIPALRCAALAQSVQDILHDMPKHDGDKIDEDTAIRNCPSDLKQLIPSEGLTEEMRERITLTLSRYQDIFALQGSPMGRTNLVSQSIDTGDRPPIRIPKRHLPIKQRDIVSDEIKKMLKDDVIEESNSPWASPIVLVKKKDGSYRFCVDYRQLNHSTRKDSYPLPNIEDTFANLAGAQYFCSLDLASGYWQVAMDLSLIHISEPTRPY